MLIEQHIKGRFCAREYNSLVASIVLYINLQSLSQFPLLLSFHRPVGFLYLYFTTQPCYSSPNSSL